MKILDIYKPTIPTLKIINPPKSQTEAITDIQPGKVFPTSHKMNKAVEIKVDKQNMAAPAKKTKKSGRSLKDVTLSRKASSRELK